MRFAGDAGFAGFAGNVGFAGFDVPVQRVKALAFNKAELLKVENLVKRYRNFTLNDVSLSVSEGEICGIIGSNGAGKTTLLKSIMGVIHTDGGDVWLYGKRAADDIIDFKARVGYIGDFEQAYPEMECTHIYRFAKNIYKEKWDDAKF
ncbi:MAG: ATP-binding cassette domain-containing protein, partial [Peptococcaceae bacterium]|nr:ATP-binding cassette domain-containing protein [Peptococcaceae bacterium]